MMNMMVVVVWMGSDNVRGWWLQEWSPSVIIIFIIIVVVSMVGSCQLMSSVLIGIVVMIVIDMVMMMIVMIVMIVMTRVGRHGSDMMGR